MAEPATPRQRRAALLHDALLFCGAFTLGAALFAIVGALWSVLGDDGDRGYWEIGLSDGLILSGLVAGELFMLWNNGLRQGARGHSIGKHRVGLRVVDAATGLPTGRLRGLARGIVMVALLDLSAAAIPIGLPTVLRRLTPESWHFGGAAYLALILLALPLLIGSRRGFADVVAGTVVLEAPERSAITARGRRRMLTVLDAAGLAGVLAVATNYLLFYWPLFFRFPQIF